MDKSVIIEIMTKQSQVLAKKKAKMSEILYIFISLKIVSYYFLKYM